MALEKRSITLCVGRGHRTQTMTPFSTLAARAKRRLLSRITSPESMAIPANRAGIRVWLRTMTTSDGLREAGPRRADKEGEYCESREIGVLNARMRLRFSAL